eukprot:scaffold247989_cov22-Tisochrysis_lutea.AAC.1
MVFQCSLPSMFAVNEVECEKGGKECMHMGLYVYGVQESGERALEDPHITPYADLQEAALRLGVDMQSAPCNLRASSPSLTLPGTYSYAKRQ